MTRTRIAQALVLCAAALVADVAAAQSVYATLAPAFGPSAFRRGGSFTTIYGSADIFLNHQSTQGRQVTRLSSGGVWTSKFGIYAQEDLGAGADVHVVLESGFNLDDGSLQQAERPFNRQATIGLRTRRWGAFELGKQFGVGLQLFVDPYFANGKISPWAYLSGVADLGKGSSTVQARVNNAVVYTAPAWGPLTTQLLWANKSNAGAGPAVQNRGMNLTWQRNGVFVVGAYNQTWCDPANDTCSDPSVRTDGYGLASVADMGNVVLSASYQQFTPQRAGNATARTYSLGTLWKPADRYILRGSLVYRNTTIAQNHAVGATVGNDYFLSKRTALYTRFSVVDNGSRSAQTIDYSAGSPLPVAGQTVRDIALGIYHNF